MNGSTGFLKRFVVNWMTHLTVSWLAVFTIEVGPVAVLVPPGSFVRQGTVSDSDVVVSVFSWERTTLVIAQRVTWGERKTAPLKEKQKNKKRAPVRERWRMVAVNKQHINEQLGREIELAPRMYFSAERIIITNTRGWWVILAYGLVDKEIHEEWGWFNQREENMGKKRWRGGKSQVAEQRIIILKSFRFTPTSSSIVLSYPELVQVSRVTNGEFIIIGVHRLLSVLHVDTQLVTTLSSNPLDVV